MSVGAGADVSTIGYYIDSWACMVGGAGSGAGPAGIVAAAAAVCANVVVAASAGSLWLADWIGSQLLVIFILLCAHAADGSIGAFDLD